MAKSQQVRVPVSALPLLDELKDQLHADSGLMVSRADALRYALVLSAWYLSTARANGDPDPPRLGGMVAQIRAAQIDDGHKPMSP